MSGWTYIEPYAGGSSVALTLLFEEFASTIHINDLNRGVYSFWFAVLNHTEELCMKIENADLSVEEWRRQKEIQSAESPDLLDLAFSTFYLNRVNRSGIILGGIIGGTRQAGRWKMDARFNKDDLTRRISKIARYRSRIRLTNCDASDLLKIVNQRRSKKFFLYLDPPYYIKGEGLYSNFYQHKDHAEIARLVAKLPHPWVVSYDNRPTILSLYRDFPNLQYGLKYSAGIKYRGQEVLFHHPSLELPEIDTPANIPFEVVDDTRCERSL